MGGNAFHTHAERLTTAQLRLLYTYTTSHLSMLFDGIDTYRFYADKATHGDLDLLCGWAEAEGPMRGEERYDDAEKEETTTRTLCEEMAKALGIEVWVKRGGAASIGIPCKLIVGEENGFAPEVDCIFFPPSSLPFAVFSTSYGSTMLILAHCLRRLSSSFTLHTSSFILRHQPFPGLPSVDVELTRDPVAFAEWVGLEYDDWSTKSTNLLAGDDDEAFANDSDMFNWITDVDHHSLMGEGLRRLASPKRGAPKSKLSGKPGEFTTFKQWLRQNVKEDKFRWSTEQLKEELSLDPDHPDLSAMTMFPSSATTPSSATPMSPSSSADAATPPSAGTINLIQSTEGVPLDHFASAALQYWNKVDAYVSALAARQTDAFLRAERRQTKKESSVSDGQKHDKEYYRQRAKEKKATKEAIRAAGSESASES